MDTGELKIRITYRGDMEIAETKQNYSLHSQRLCGDSESGCVYG